MLRSPSAIVVDQALNIYILDHLNLAIRNISANGTVSTFFSSNTKDLPLNIRSTGVMRVFRPGSLARDALGNFYFFAEYMLWKLTCLQSSESIPPASDDVTEELNAQESPLDYFEFEFPYEEEEETSISQKSTIIFNSNTTESTTSQIPMTSMSTTFAVSEETEIVEPQTIMKAF
jgi:hypothetical protein